VEKNPRIISIMTANTPFRNSFFWFAKKVVNFIDNITMSFSCPYTNYVIKGSCARHASTCNMCLWNDLVWFIPHFDTSIYEWKISFLFQIVFSSVAGAYALLS
jgi:hypothetical protein